MKEVLNTKTVVCIGSKLPTTPQPGNPGDHWPQFLHGLLMANLVGTRVELIDECLPEQRLHHLRERWADDVLWYQPDVVVVMIGITDAYYNLQDRSDRMLEQEWAECLCQIIATHRTESPHTDLIFIEPFLHTLGFIPEAEELKKYQRQARQVCEEAGCAFVPLAAAMQDRITAQGEFSLGTSLNPNIEAQLMIADAVSRKIVLPPERTCPSVDDEILLCIGDSITDVGRRDPVTSSLGFGYVRFAHALWRARTSGVQMIRNEGIAGNTVRDLKGRWDRDVLAYNPKRVTIKIGINDVNRYLSASSAGVSPQEYRETFDNLLTQLRELRNDCAIYLIQPFYLSRMTDPLSYRTRVLVALEEYHAVVRDMAKKHAAKVLETHRIFQTHLGFYHQKELAREPVHLNLIGHTILAEEFLRFLD